MMGRLSFFALHASMYFLFFVYALRQFVRFRYQGPRNSAAACFCTCMLLFFALELPLALAKAADPFSTSIGPAYAYSFHIIASGSVFGLLSSGIIAFWDQLSPASSKSRTDMQHYMVLLVACFSAAFVVWAILVDVQMLASLDPHGYISSNPPLHLSMEACATVLCIFAGSGLMFYILQVYGPRGPFQPVWVLVSLMVGCFVVRALMLVLLCACPMMTQNSPSDPTFSSKAPSVLFQICAKVCTKALQ